MSTEAAFTFETFRGDLDALHEMAVTSWRDEYGRASFPDLYRPELVRFLTAHDVPDDHLRAAYDGDACVAFVANLPRRLAWRGRTVRACLAALLVCRKAYLRKGLAEGLIRSALPLRDEYGYEVVLFYNERGHRSAKLFAKLRAEGARIEVLRGLTPWVRVLDLERARESEGLSKLEALALRAIRAGRAPRSETPPGLRPFRPDDAPRAAELLNEHATHCEVARLFDEDEARHLLDEPPLSFTRVVERDGRVVGLLHWMRQRHEGTPPEDWAWVHHVALQGLSGRDRRALYAAFLREAKEQGCVGVIEWGMGYHGTGVLWRNGFFPYPRGLDLCAWSFDDDLPGGRVRRLFDMQI